MSIDAIRWAWMQHVGRASAKLVLLSIADRAGEHHTAYPSIDRIHRDTELDRKTIMACLDHLTEIGLITAEKSNGKGSRYTLVGVVGREQTSTKNGTGTKNGTAPVPKTGPVPVPKTGH